MSKKEPIIIFMGTPDFSVPVLKGLLENYKIKLVVTQPDKPVGRGGKIKYTPIKEVALENNIEIMQPNKITEIIDKIKSIQPDLIITCAYGQILPLELLEIPKLGCINVHASLLPKLRGGAPIHHAIIDGYSKTGVTIMYMAEGMDDGDIISQKNIAIEEEDTAETLHDKLSIVGKELLLETLPSIIDKTNERIVQDESEVTYGLNITREEEKIDFTKEKNQIFNQIRGLNSWPGAYCYFDDKVLKVWKSYKTNNTYDKALPGEITKIYKDGFGVKCNNGEIVITEVQLAGKGKVKASDFINGHHDLVGKVLK